MRLLTWMFQCPKRGWLPLLNNDSFLIDLAEKGAVSCQKRPDGLVYSSNLL